jgi:hypothetical protein
MFSTDRGSRCVAWEEDPSASTEHATWLAPEASGPNLSLADGLPVVAMAAAPPWELGEAALLRCHRRLPLPSSSSASEAAPSVLSAPGCRISVTRNATVYFKDGFPGGTKISPMGGSAMWRSRAPGISLGLKHQAVNYVTRTLIRVSVSRPIRIRRYGTSPKNPDTWIPSYIGKYQIVVNT